MKTPDALVGLRAVLHPRVYLAAFIPFTILMSLIWMAHIAGAADATRELNHVGTVSPVPGSHLPVDQSHKPDNAHAIRFGNSAGEATSVQNAISLSYGETVTSTLETPGQVVTYTFPAAAGDVALVRVSSISGISPEIQLYDPNGSLLDTAGGSLPPFFTAEITQSLSTTGDHTILVSDPGDVLPLTYTLYLQRLNGPSSATDLSFGQTVTGNVGSAGELDAYTFLASADDTVLVRVSPGVQSSLLEMRLYDPDGTLLWSEQEPNLEVTTTLAITGVYAILVGDSGGAITGSYSLHLQRLNGPGNVTALFFGQTVTGTIALPAEMDAYTFSAVDGDLILVRGGWILNGFLPEIRLYDPSGNLVNTGDNVPPAVGIEISRTLSSAGTYSILASAPGDIAAGGTVTGTYPLHLQRLNNPGNATTLSYGQTLTGTISLPAEMDAYTFLANAGDTIHITVTQTSGNLWPDVRLHQSDGRLLTSVAGGTQVGISRTLLAAGTHTILVGDNFASETGTYELQLQQSGGVSGILALLISGPRNVSPGRTVDYAIEYGNLMGETVQDLVVVARLPWDAEYVSSTSGGLYLWERHQVVWKLGDAPPGQSDVLSVRLRYGWGLSDEQQESIVAVAVGRNLPNAAVDLDEYLSFTPITVETERNLTPEEVDSLLASDSQLADLFSYAQELGFQFYNTAQEVMLSDGSQLVQLWLLNLDDREVAAIVHRGESRLIYKFADTTLEIFERDGGAVWDSETQAIDAWGTWADAPPNILGQLGIQAEPSFKTCMENCILKELPGVAVGLLFKKVRPILSGFSCFWCGFTQDVSSCEKCAGAIAEAVLQISGLGTVVDIVSSAKKCTIDCLTDPTQHACGDHLPPECSGPPWWALSTRNLDWTGQWLCNPDTGRYDVRVVESCFPFERCVNGQCEACDTFIGAVQGRIPHAVSDPGRICTASSDNVCPVPFDSTVSPAHDPNAKHGPSEVLPGEVITYMLEYENEGEGIAFGVYVQDRLPDALDEGTLVIENDGVYFPGTRTIVWSIGELQPSEQGSVRFSVQVPMDAVSGTEIINTATVFFPSVPEETPTNPVVSVVRTVVASPQAVETFEETPVDITLTGATVGTWPLSYTIVSEPLNGSLSGTPPEVTYAPASNFEGLDRFAFKVSNSLTESVPAEVTILVRTGQETTSPEVVATAPVSGTVDVPVFRAPVSPNIYQPFIWVGFSEPISATTVTTETLIVHDERGQQLSGQVVYDGITNSARFLPAQPLRSLTAYTGTVTTGIRDTSGNALAADYEWQFHTTCSFDYNNNQVVDTADVQFIAHRWQDADRYGIRYDVAPEMPDGVINVLDIMTAVAHWDVACP